MPPQRTNAWGAKVAEQRRIAREVGLHWKSVQQILCGRREPALSIGLRLARAFYALRNPGEPMDQAELFAMLESLESRRRRREADRIRRQLMIWEDDEDDLED